MKERKNKGYMCMGTHDGQEKKSKKANMEWNSRREVREDLRNVEF
jgi:hypothetical protein